MDKKIKSRFNKRNVLSGVILSVVFCFTVCFFSPIDIFIGNQTDFAVGYDKIFIPMLILALAGSAVMTAVLGLCLLIHQRLFDTVKYLLFGLLCAMYIQMIFYNGRMTSITGDANLFYEVSVYALVNYVFFMAATFAPLILWGIKKRFPNIKPLKKISGKAVPFVCLVLACMQIAGTGSLLLKNGLREIEEDDYIKYLSYSESMKLSDKENIVVFLTDRLDSIWLDDVLDEYPEVYDMFEGFTFYKNNVSEYTHTFPSVPQMLTDYEYNDKPWNDYLNEAWQSHNLMDILNENGFRINLLIDSLTTFNKYDYIKDVAANCKSLDEGYSLNYISNESGIVPTLFTFSLLKLSPYLIKGKIAQGYESDFSNHFYKDFDEMTDRYPNAMGVKSDIMYYNSLKSVGLSTDSDKRTFSFIHLSCSHDASLEISRFNPDFEGTEFNHITTTRGDFEILREYFSQMKKLGIYDSSTIIVLGDHGRPPSEIDYDVHELSGRIVTGLLIKPSNAKRVPLKTESKSELSNAYFSASILEYAGIDHEQYGISYNDVINQQLHTERELRVYLWKDNNFGYVCKYLINGDARDFDNWKYVR